MAGDENTTETGAGEGAGADRRPTLGELLMRQLSTARDVCHHIADGELNAVGTAVLTFEFHNLSHVSALKLCPYCAGRLSAEIAFAARR